MIVLDSNDIKRRVAAARRGETERVAIEAAYHMLGGSENWIVRQAAPLRRENWEYWWLENRQNGRRVEFHTCPARGLEVELSENPSNDATQLMSRARLMTSRARDG